MLFRSVGTETSERNWKILRNKTLTELTQKLNKKIGIWLKIWTEKKTKWQHRIKIIAILCLIKRCCFFAPADFPSENPRTQTRNYSYTRPLALMLEQVCGIEKKPSLFLIFFWVLRQSKTKNILRNFKNYCWLFSSFTEWLTLPKQRNRIKNCGSQTSE